MEITPTTYVNEPQSLSSDSRLIQENEQLRRDKLQLEEIIRRQEATITLAKQRAVDASGSRSAQGEASLPMNDYRLSNLIANLQDGILLEDEHRLIVLVNQHFCDLFSVPVTPEQLKGMDCSGMAEQSQHFFKHPDQFVERVNQLLIDQKQVVGEELELADGRIFDRDYVPIFTGDVYSGHLWRYADITRRKHAENAALRQKEKYQRIIENMNLGLIEVDLDEQIVYTNQSFCIMSGYESHELIGQKATDILLNGQQVQFMKDKNNSRLKGTSDAYEVAINSRQGKSMWWLISGAPLYSETGDVIGSIGIHLDITNQKQFEAELRIAKQEAERLSRAKELFLANMSHEIRTPMNAILNLGQQLTKTTMTDHQRFSLGMINTAASNLLVIINDILDFSKIEAGELSLEHIGFDLADLIRRAVQVMAHNAKVKGLRLATTIDSDVEPVLMGDPFRLNQILLNLIGNAIKFTNAGSVYVRCECSTSATHQQVELTVTDTGIGMDADFQRNLFTKFTQEDGSTGRRYGGTGLGMSITKQLVDLMGGQIRVESQKHKGTSVHVHLSFPIGTRTDLETNDPEIRDDGRLVSKRILLVEDNEMNRLVATTILESYGIVITEATDGKRAVDRLRTESFDLVLMDVQMPVMDGLEATRIIRREISSSIPVIALTASAIRTEKEECFKAGMNDFLSKPFDEKGIIDKLTKWLTSNGAAPDTDRRTEEPKKAVLTETNHTAAGRPLYDLSMLETMSYGNQEFLQKMIALFRTDAPEVASQMSRACETGDYKTVKTLAHRIKPSIDTMGIASQTDAIRQIEQLAGSQTDLAALNLLVADFDRVMRDVVERLPQF